jgi:hypothetical protein
MNGKLIKNLSNPVDNNDGANKTYVDNRIITNSNLIISRLFFRFIRKSANR